MSIAVLNWQSGIYSIYGSTNKVSLNPLNDDVGLTVSSISNLPIKY